LYTFALTFTFRFHLFYSSNCLRNSLKQGIQSVIHYFLPNLLWLWLGNSRLCKEERARITEVRWIRRTSLSWEDSNTASYFLFVLFLFLAYLFTVEKREKPDKKIVVCLSYLRFRAVERMSLLILSSGAHLQQLLCLFFLLFYWSCFFLCWDLTCSGILPYRVFNRIEVLISTVYYWGHKREKVEGKCS